MNPKFNEMISEYAQRSIKSSKHKAEATVFEVICLEIDRSLGFSLQRKVSFSVMLQSCRKLHISLIFSLDTS